MDFISAILGLFGGGQQRDDQKMTEAGQGLAQQQAQQQTAAPQAQMKNSDSGDMLMKLIKFGAEQGRELRQPPQQPQQPWYW